MDDGLFGPGSVTWRVHVEPVMFVAGIRALLLQSLEPRVMRGTYQNSALFDPAKAWARFQRTVEFVGTRTFGSTDEVEAAGATAHVRRLDLRDPQRGTRVVDELAQAMGGLDTLVLCAGTGTSTLLLDMSYLEWRDTVAVDLDGAFCCLQAGARHMVQGGRGGRVVAITSVHEHAPRVGAAPYCAAKGGLGLLVKVAALELAEHGITVNAVAPGEIATPMTGQEDESVLEGKHRPGIPVARPGDAREVAAVVGFLCSPEAGNVTGASWAIDGGMLQMGPMAGSHMEGDAWRRP